MCGRVETFFGIWELRTGCFVAAFLGVFYSTLMSVFVWVGPFSKQIKPGLLTYSAIFITVYNTIIGLVAFLFLYGVLKEKTCPVKAYKHMWNYLVSSVAFIWIGEFVTMVVIHKLYMACIAIFLVTFFLTGFNIYFAIVIKSYQLDISEE